MRHKDNDEIQPQGGLDEELDAVDRFSQLSYELNLTSNVN